MRGNTMTKKRLGKALVPLALSGALILSGCGGSSYSYSDGVGNSASKYDSIATEEAMAYDDAGRVMIRLCIEANIRYTMGNVNLGIRRCLPPDMDAEWSLSAGSPYVVSALRSLPLPIFSPR